MPYIVCKAHIPKADPKYIWVRNYKNYDNKTFCATLETCPWSSLEQLDDPHEQWKAFHHMFLEIAGKQAPMIRKRVRGRDCPWQNSELHEVMDMRDRAKVKANQSRNETDFETYKTLRNKATSMNRDLKREYYSNLILENLSSSDKLWKAIKIILPTSASVQTQLLRVNGNEYTTPKGISDCFNRFFSTVGRKLTANQMTSQILGILD
jgi:hypothetical protein